MIHSNLTGSETRLLRYTVETIKKQQEKAGIKPTVVGTPTSYSGASVSAGANASKQAQTYQTTLEKNQDGIAPIVGSSAPATLWVDTPGGNMGYDSSVYAPTLDASGNMTGVQQNTQKTTEFDPQQDWRTTGSKPTPQQELNARLGAIDGNLFGSSIQDVAAAKQVEIERFNTELAQREAATAKAAEAASRSAMSAAAGTPGAPQSRFQGPGDSAPDRQSFIEQQRAAGKTDMEIRQMINTLPPEQTGGVSPTATTDPTSTAGGPTPSPDAPGSTTPAPRPEDPTKPGSTPTDQPQVNPGTNFLRNLAATVEDPIMQAILNAEADRADASLSTNPELSYSQFAKGEDGKALAQPYDAIGEILRRADTRATETYDDQKEFLKGQYDRNEKLMADKEESVNNQLQFTQDKSVRDQTDAKRKQLDSETIMLALQGGFGSADGNREISEARLKGEQAIIDLNKEFGFKKTDVSLAFTEMHNQAFDNYRTSWLTALENFETKTADLDIDSIANEQSKSSALGTNYQSYVDEIKEGRKEYANKISEGTKMVYDAIQAEKEAEAIDRRWQSEFDWQQDSWTRTFEANADERALRREEAGIAAGVKADDKETARFDKKVGALRSRIDGDDTMKQYRDAKVSWDSFQAAYKLDNNPFNDRAMAKSYEKLVEVTSVVMPGEYADIISAAPLGNKILGKFQQVVNGGQSWTDDERNALKEISEQLYGQYKGRYDQQSQGYLMEINAYNSDIADSDNMIYPSMLGLPESTTGQQRSTLDEYWNDGETEGPFSYSGPAPKISDVTNKDLAFATVGGKKITGQPFLVSALEKADREFFEKTGKHIQVNQHFRDSATQAKLYKELSPKGARVAPPGKSFHEKGLAIDVTNWKEAQPYLTKYGLVNGLPDDMGHFSFGEMNPEALAHFSGDGHNHA